MAFAKAFNIFLAFFIFLRIHKKSSGIQKSYVCSISPPTINQHKNLILVHCVSVDWNQLVKKFLKYVLLQTCIFILDYLVLKKCSTGKRFICTEVTSYKIHTLNSKKFYNIWKYFLSSLMEKISFIGLIIWDPTIPSGK